MPRGPQKAGGPFQSHGSHARSRQHWERRSTACFTEARIDVMPVRDTRIIEYPCEAGVGLQNLGVLIVPKAHVKTRPVVLASVRDSR